MKDDLENYKRLLRCGLIYQIEEAKRLRSIKENESQSKLSDLMITHYEHLLLEVDTLRSITKVKQWFRDISAYPVETGDTRYEIYLEQQTGLKVELFGKLVKRVERYLDLGYIKSEQQYLDVETVFHLYSAQNKPDELLVKLDALLFSFKG